jgi:multicomponent Na+:H+ antiporter subunit E
MNHVLNFATGGLRAFLVRTASGLCFWLVLIGAKPSDFAAGVPVAIAASWASLQLLPPGQWRLGPLALMQLALRFVFQSALAGADVALRALDPRLPLRPGFVTFAARIPPGSGRSAFCTMTSLLPGTLPVDVTSDGGIVFHCLDVSEPIVAQMAADEALFMRAFASEASHD